MKNSIITFLLGFFFLISCYKAIGAEFRFTNENNCLEIDGKISNATEKGEGYCTIELISENAIVSSVVLTGGKKKFKLLLKKNANYSIRISRKGYISKLISVDTKIDSPEEELYRFSFETSLLKESSATDMNKELLDFPVTLIYFDRKKDCFIYDKEYTTKIKKEVVMK